MIDKSIINRFGIALIGTFFFSHLAFAQISREDALSLMQQSKKGDLSAVGKLKNSAQAGDKIAQWAFGAILFRGDGVEKNNAEAVKWSIAAAKQGEGNAYVNVAKAYEFGIGGLPKSPIISAVIYKFIYSRGAQAAGDLNSKLLLGFSSNQITEYENLQKKATESNNLFEVLEEYLNSSIKPTANGNAIISANGVTWTDTKTGLTWTVCHYGEVNPPNCSASENDGGKNIKLSWFDAIYEAKNANIAGNKDWRIPTVNEILTVFKCLAGRGTVSNHSFTYIDLLKDQAGFTCQQRGIGQPEFIESLNASNAWTSSAAIKYGYIDDRNAAFYVKHKPRLFAAEGRISTDGSSREGKNILLVRGGVPEQDWLESLSDAKEIKELVNSEILAEQVARNKTMENSQNRERKEAETIRNQKIKYDADTAKLRKNIKIGDSITRGLVLDIKGDLILIQTYKDQCTLFTSDGRCNTFGHKRVAAGTEHIRRADVFPLTN